MLYQIIDMPGPALRPAVCPYKNRAQVFEYDPMHTLAEFEHHCLNFLSTPNHETDKQYYDN